MKIKFMNRNVLKVIAIVAMLIDHIGWLFFPNVLFLRIIGRLAFPIFAFFIAEGMRYTRNRKAYIHNLIRFALITEPAFLILFKWLHLNILFTFLIAVILICLIDGIKTNKKRNTTWIILISVFMIIAEVFNLFNYGITGVLVILVFYYSKNLQRACGINSVILAFYSVQCMFSSGFSNRSVAQIFSLLSLLLIACCYNGNKGKLNLKYLFYWFYPVHLTIFAIIKLIL